MDLGVLAPPSIKMKFRNALRCSCALQVHTFGISQQAIWLITSSLRFDWRGGTDGNIVLFSVVVMMDGNKNLIDRPVVRQIDSHEQMHTEIHAGSILMKAYTLKLGCSKTLRRSKI